MYIGDYQQKVWQGAHVVGNSVVRVVSIQHFFVAHSPVSARSGQGICGVTGDGRDQTCEDTRRVYLEMFVSVF